MKRLSPAISSSKSCVWCFLLGGIVFLDLICAHGAEALGADDEPVATNLGIVGPPGRCYVGQSRSFSLCRSKTRPLDRPPECLLFTSWDTTSTLVPVRLGVTEAIGEELLSRLTQNGGSTRVR
jgi:hypothetical protein